MRRPSRNVEIFSLSSLDLFASAMGAFIIIAILLFPYYLRTNQARHAAADKTSQIEDLKRSIAEARRQEQQAIASDTLTRTRNRRKATEAEIKIKRTQARALKEKIKKSVQFVFLGLKTTADSFTLVIDMSGSMQHYKGLAFRATDRIINALKAPQKLSIIGFNITGQKPHLWYWPSRNSLAVAELANKKAASGFIHDLSGKFKGATPTYHALQAALDTPSEAIVLMTDGTPTYPRGMQAKQIIQLITTANTGKKEIHAVGLGEFNARPFFLDFMEGLAHNNGGGFTGLAR